MRTLCLLLLCSIVLFKATGQAGSLDSSFGNNGTFRTNYFPTSTAVQGSKIVVAGYILIGNNNYAFALARYTADGTRDASFGGTGLVITDFNDLDDRANAVVIQGDKIILAGYTTYFDTDFGVYFKNFALARYTTDGRLDSSFGENGKLIYSVSFKDDLATSMVLQGDKIVVSGIGYDSGNETLGFALARFTADGVVDHSFGFNGGLTNSIGVYKTSVAIQGDKIIVGGTYKFGENPEIILIRYTADGAQDGSFGENGLVVTDNESANSITVQGEKIIVGGLGLVRYTVDGALDSSFGENGSVITGINTNSIALQGNKIIVGGSAGNPENNTIDFALARYTTNGVLDASFGVNGKVLTDIGGSDAVQGIALHENRLYAVGSTSLGGGDNGAVAAYKLEAPVPAISISIADVTVYESQKYAVVTVRLSAPSTQVVRVHYITHNKTATCPKDYHSVKGTLQFAAGTTTAKIKIPIVNDNIAEHTEQFKVLLSNPQNATLLDSIGIVTIKDDDNKALMTAQVSTALQSDAQVTGQESTSLHIMPVPTPLQMPSPSSYRVLISSNR